MARPSHLWFRALFNFYAVINMLIATNFFVALVAF